MFPGGAKYSTERVKCSTESLNIPTTMSNVPQMLNIPRTMSNVPRRCYIFHKEVRMFPGGAKYSTERVKCSTEVLNIPRTMSNVPRRC